MDLLSRKEFAWHDFSGQDLTKNNLSYSKFIRCNFDRCNLEKVDCTHSIFSGSSFKDTNCRFTDFAHSDMQDTFFYPKDAYGVTFTMNCKTFKGMRMSKLWWFCFHYFTLMAIPELDKGKDPRDKVILALGEERYRRLSQLFARRGM